MLPVPWLILLVILNPGKMLSLPHDDQGLPWIASHGPTQLRLIPGLQAATITAAADGHQQALAHVCLKAQEYADCNGVQGPALRVVFWLSASQAVPQSYAEALQLRTEVEKRTAHERTFIQAASGGRVAAPKWLRVLCHPTNEPGPEMMLAAAESAATLLLA
ncbi:hypothetical protein WJX84_001121 [Apatococcus fuscideae]|uniref:Uncharacterized protein n=1 Tax=Apatococcus fuscideae TaxID=2026836 RepID=A0AAW1T5Y6_9CHLO